MKNEMKHYRFSGGPFADVVVVDNDLMFLSGLISEDMETGEYLEGDIAAETCQTLNNLEKLLKEYGSDMEHVIRVEVILHEYKDCPEMNAEYVKHFNPEKMPARVCFGGVDLAAGCKIELMVIARKIKE